MNTLGSNGARPLLKGRPVLAVGTAATRPSTAGRVCYTQLALGPPLVLVLHQGADQTGLIRTLFVVSITQFEGVVETLFSVLGCQRDSYRVYLIPALSCRDPIQGVAITLTVIVSLLPVAMTAYLQ
jgi:hypothetical protein